MSLHLKPVIHKDEEKHLIECCDSNNNERTQGNLTSSFHFILSLFETIFLQVAGLLAKV